MKRWGYSAYWLLKISLTLQSQEQNARWILHPTKEMHRQVQAELYLPHLYCFHHTKKNHFYMLIFLGSFLFWNHYLHYNSKLKFQHKNWYYDNPVEIEREERVTLKPGVFLLLPCFPELPPNSLETLDFILR